MKIKAKTKLNYKPFRSYVRTTVFRKEKPLKKMLLYCLIASLLCIILLLEMKLLGATTLPVILMIAAVLMLLFEVYLFFIFPLQRFNALGELRGCEYEYVFHDEAVDVVAKDNGYDSTSKIRYTSLLRVIEAGNYVYLCTTKTYVLILEKKDLAEEELTALTTTLKTCLKDRYITYH